MEETWNLEKTLEPPGPLTRSKKQQQKPLEQDEASSTLIPQEQSKEADGSKYKVG